MDNEKIYVVYIHINKLNNKKYIGITSINVEKRWGLNGNGYKKQPFFNAISKYGWKNFEHLILYEDLKKEDAEKKEIELIEEYNTSDKNYGYNCDLGGLSNIFSYSHKNKIRNSLKKYVKTEDHKRNISYSKIGKNPVITKENRLKMSNRWKGKNNPFYGIDRSGENNSFYGKHHSRESKEKLRDCHIGLKHSEKTKQKMSESRSISVNQYNKNNVYIGTYYGIREAERQTGIGHYQISKCCMKSKNFNTAGGYKWFYEDDEIQPDKTKIKRMEVDVID